MPVKLIPTGTTLLSFKLSIGKTAIAGCDLYTNEAIAGLLPKNPEHLSDSFLFHLFNGKYIDLSGTGYKAFGQSLNSKFLREEIQIPLPPLAIQQQIVAECEAVDAQVAQAHIALEQAQKTLQQKISQATTKTKTLGQVASRVSALVDPQKESGTVFYIGLENIAPHSGLLLGQAMSAYADIKSAKTQFAANDVLYGKLRPNLNKVHLANRAGICSTDILAFRFASSDLAYLYSHYLRTQAFNTAAVSTMAGQQLPRTSWEKLSPIPVPDFSTIDIPPLRAAMQALEAKIHAAQTVIDAAPAAKQAILQKHL